VGSTGHRTSSGPGAMLTSSCWRSWVSLRQAGQAGHCPCPVVASCLHRRRRLHDPRHGELRPVRSGNGPGNLRERAVRDRGQPGHAAPGAGSADSPAALGTVVIWVVPLVARIVAGYLVYDRMQQVGRRSRSRSRRAAVSRRGRRSCAIAACPSVTSRTSISAQTTAASSFASGCAALPLRSRARGRSSGSCVLSSAVLRHRAQHGADGPYIEVIPGEGKARTSFMGVIIPRPR
jgi:hypothetical protein